MAEGEVDHLQWAPESILTCPGTLLHLNNLEMLATSPVPQNLLRTPLKFAFTHMFFSLGIENGIHTISQSLSR